MASKDILLPDTDGSEFLVNRSLLVAFVPITVALLGVALILFGGVSAHEADVSSAAAATSIDPMTTGSVATPDDQRRALEMLDN
jgi:hypothetical protein